MGYRVKAASAVGYRPNGSHWMGYQGQPVPVGDLRGGEVERLEEGGFIESDQPAQAAGSDRPAKSASKDEWVAYAQAHGDADAADKTKDELIAEHGEK